MKIESERNGEALQEIELTETMAEDIIQFHYETRHYFIQSSAWSIIFYHLYNVSGEKNIMPG
jgi:hypothetical protein